MKAEKKIIPPPEPEYEVSLILTRTEAERLLDMLYEHESSPSPSQAVTLSSELRRLGIKRGTHRPYPDSEKKNLVRVITDDAARFFASWEGPGT